MPKPSVGLTTWQVLRLLWHLPNFARLYWRLFTDRRVPLRAQAVLIAAVLYVLDPFDFVARFFFSFFCLLDDLAGFVFSAPWFIFLLPPDVVQGRGPGVFVKG